jgi:hypothetical protein
MHNSLGGIWRNEWPELAAPQPRFESNIVRSHGQDNLVRAA